MPIPNIAFWCEVISVPSTNAGADLYSLIQAQFATLGRTDVIDQQCATFQITAGALNAGSVFVGDYSMNIAVPPGRGIGAELLAGEGLFVPYQGGGMGSANLSEIYVTSSAAGQYIVVRCNQML